MLYGICMFESEVAVIHSVALLQVLIVDLDNHKFVQRMGDEKTILPKKLHRSLLTALDMAKSGEFL